MLRVRLQRISDEAGFTLLELLGVAVIMILLSLMALPIYADITDYVRVARSRSDLRTIEHSLERYKAELGHYPNRLGMLVEHGYLKPNTTFESPWSNSENRIYFFYAVDRVTNSQAFILADPGPGAPDCMGNGVINQDTLSQSTAAPFPCGRNPYTANQAARAWLDDTGGDALKLDPVPAGGAPAHMKDYRPGCQASDRDAARATKCHYKAES